MKIKILLLLMDLIPLVSLFACLPVVCLSVCLYLSVCLSVCLFIFLYVCLSVYLSVCLSVYLSVCLFICLSVCLSVCYCYIHLFHILIGENIVNQIHQISTIHHSYNNSNILLLLNNKQKSIKCIIFDLNPNLVIKGYKLGYSIFYGDPTQSLVLATAGIDRNNVKLFVLTDNNLDNLYKQIERLNYNYYNIPIITRLVS